ncbi:hypothetical protein DSM104299_01090 [Baekduia alba]|uniref:hypothetical protein n=1 Tax=Baekduia alba TaxID=2997333 RepID=UPI002341B958|nr:hypothetical protein [Baekduia alba]WCB92396.1 hypothetical protein DSM104299_01090 [Baekduia alba]
MTARRRLSPRTIAIVAVATVVVLVVGFAAARWLTTENRERDALFDLVQAEAAGDAPQVLAQLHGCDAACADKVRAFLPKVTGPGAVKIARLDSGTSYSFGTTTGTSRVVWVHGVDSRPLVQCVVVRRQGGPLTGRSVSLLRLSAPLADNEDSC